MKIIVWKMNRDRFGALMCLTRLVLFHGRCNFRYKRECLGGPALQMAESVPQFCSLHRIQLIFTPLQFPLLHFNFQPLFLEILDFLRTLKSLHFNSLNTFLTFSLYILDFPALQNPFTSLLTFQTLFLEILISSSLEILFTSLHLSLS